MRRIYLDNAATSWPKPDAVYQAVDDYLRNNGAPAGRSGYAEAAEASRLVETARRDVARILGVVDSERIIFTCNGTDSLNQAIHGLLRSGDHVVTTVVEHNSVLRPLRALEDGGTISVTRVPCDALGYLDPEDIRRALRPHTRLVAVAHASNVTGAIQPVEVIREIAHQHGALMLVDAAQTIGHFPIELDVEEFDLVAASGHKGLLGPLGTGVLCLRPGMDEKLEAMRQGGTGTRSEDDRQPAMLPSKYESGNINVPGVVGVGAAAVFLFRKTLAAVRDHHADLTKMMLEGLAEQKNVRVYGPPSDKPRVGLVSFTIDGYDPQEAAAALDAVHRIQVRPGLHCAPLMHQSLGTVERGGTIRVSLGQFNTPEDIQTLLVAVADLASGAL